MRLGTCDPTLLGKCKHGFLSESSLELDDDDDDNATGSSPTSFITSSLLVSGSTAVLFTSPQRQLDLDCCSCPVCPCKSFNLSCQITSLALLCSFKVRFELRIATDLMFDSLTTPPSVCHCRARLSLCQCPTAWTPSRVAELFDAGFGDAHVPRYDSFMNFDKSLRSETCGKYLIDNFHDARGRPKCFNELVQEVH